MINLRQLLGKTLGENATKWNMSGGMSDGIKKSRLLVVCEQTRNVEEMLRMFEISKKANLFEVY